MNKKNMKKVFSLILIAIMLTVNVTPALAAVTHYVAEKEGVKYQYAQEDLIASYYGDKKLYNDYLTGDLKALLDDKNGYIEAQEVFKYIANTKDVYVNNYTESKEAKVIEVGNVINLDSDGNPIEDETGLKVVEVSFINANTISVIFEGIEKAVEIELEEALVHGQTKVTFVYKEVEYTATLKEAYVDPSEVAYVASDFTYEGSTITGFSEAGLSKFETKKNVNLPDKSTDGTTIKAIGENAFKRDDFISGTDEFTSPNGIKTLVFPTNLVEIGEGAFRYNALEGEVVFPETLEKIGNFAFFGNRITEVNLPDSVTEIGISSFATNKIEKVNTSVNMKSIASGSFTRNLMLGEVTLHKGLERIEQGAFHSSNLTQLIIPSTVTFIGRDAFYGHDLTSVDIPASVETIDRGAFQQKGATTLENVILNEGLKKIGQQAFADANISEVKLPSSLETLDYRAFKGNLGVVRLYSENPIHLTFNEQKDASTTQWVELTAVEETYVASDFNYGYMNFKPVMQPERQIFVITGFSEQGMEKSQTNGDLVIPKTVEIEESGEHTTKSVEGIDREAFKDIALKSVVFPETIGEYDFVINTSAFANTGLEEVIFNEGIKAIKEGAFTNNNLTEVYFPSTTLTIGNNSFAHNKISNLVFSDDVAAIQIDNYTFYDNELKEVHLPYSIFKFLGYVFKGNPGTELLPESQLDANDPEGTGVVQIYTRNPVHLTSDTYIALSKYHNIVNVAEGIDRTDLYSTIQNAKSIVLSDYPHTNIDTFLTVLSVAKEVFKDEKATQSNIDNSLASLTDAISTLMESGNDKSNLRILIREAKGYSSQVYTTETYTVLESAIEEAEALLLDPTAAGEEVVIAEGKIRSAIDSLVVKSDIVFTKEDFIYEGNAITGFSFTGEEKFKHNKNLVLPDESPDEIIIEVIGESAFQNVEPIWGSDTATPVGGIETVKLPSQLKRIEDSAFKYNSLEEVNFPQTLEYIGGLAFNANLLKSVYLPDSVIELGQGVFSLNKITELRLSPNLTEIENGTFSRNIHLENVELNEGLTRIGQSAFIGAPIKSIEFPSTLKIIERMAFSSSRLESVRIPSNVEVIETQAFKQNLKFRTLKEVTFEEGLKSIGEGAFMDGMISEVYLPHSLEKLGQTAFEGNINADKKSIIVKLHTTNEAHLNFETTKSKVHQQIILEAAPSTYALTFNVNDEAGIKVEGATIQVKDVEGRVVEDLAAVERGEYSYTVSKEGYVNATGTIVVSGEDVTIDVILLAEVVSEFVIDSSTGTITKYTGNNVNLVIPSEIAGVPVKAIGKQVFAKKGIESVQIPEGVETIGNGSFIQNNLTTVILPSTVKTIEALAFANNKSLIEINLNEGLETIGNQVFQNTPLSGATIIIPSTVMNIGNSAFKGQNIDQMIIKGDENSASIKFGVPIGDNGLNLKFESPKKNAELVWNSFGCADNNNYVDLGNIELTANTSEELKVALENNVNIKIVGIYKAVDSGMEDIRVAKPIPWDLSQVEMNQETITLSQKISLGNEYFPLMEGYTAPTLGLCNANNYYSIDVVLSNEVEEVESDFVIDENGVITAYNGSETELVIPNQVDGVNVTEIGDKVFLKKGLTSVEIPNTVITIGEGAFSTNKLTSITLPKNLETIKKAAFQNNTLGSLAVPSSVKTIGNAAFSKNKIEELSLPEGLKTIEDGAFQANSLTELTIPGSVEVITSLSFSVNPNLRSVFLEEGIKEISANAFTNNEALTGEITLPSTLEHLYTSAFNRTGVTSLYVKGNEDSSLIEIHSGISPDLADIRFESPYKEAYIVFNASGNLVVDLGTIDYSGEVDDLQTYLEENLLVKESAYHVNKQDNTGKSDIVILADIDWNLVDGDLSSGTVVIYGTAKDFTSGDLESKGEDFTPPNPSGLASENTYMITINLVS